MSNPSPHYRPELLAAINADHQPTFETHCTLEQGRKLKELGVTTYSGARYFENIISICVRPEMVADDKRQHYSSLITDDPYGFPIEVLVEDVKIFQSGEVGDWPIGSTTGFIAPFRADAANRHKMLLTEYNKFPAYSEHELEAMYIRTGQGGNMPQYRSGDWRLVKDGTYTATNFKEFENRAEALAQGIIDILEKAPEAAPKLPKLELRTNINFNSPEAQARMANLQKSVDSLNSHKTRQRCPNGCANCKCNPVYGTRR